MEHRIHALEKSLAGKIIIESNQWENLESRVLLLETRQALTSAQVQEFNICLEVWNCTFNFCCNCGIMLLSPKTHFDDEACVPWWKAVTFSRYTCTSKALTCVSFKNGKFIWKVQYFRKTANHFIGQMNPYGSWACYFRTCFNGKFLLSYIHYLCKVFTKFSLLL